MPFSLNQEIEALATPLGLPLTCSAAIRQGRITRYQRWSYRLNRPVYDGWTGTDIKDHHDTQTGAYIAYLKRRKDEAEKRAANPIWRWWDSLAPEDRRKWRRLFEKEWPEDSLPEWAFARKETE